MSDKNLLIDVVIPTHKKDLQILEYCIEAARRKIVNVRRIIVISKERHSDNAEWFDESKFPFSFESVGQIVKGSVGWYFQQLLKLYAPLVIPGISENVLVLDSDTVFFRRVAMVDCKGRALYNISKDKNVRQAEFDQRVAKHIESLLPAIALQNLPKEFQEVSGIAHNMVFNKSILSDLFKRVEESDGSGDPFYKIFLKKADGQHSVSEYQTYFNFITVFHRDKIAIRKLSYKNTADINIKKYRWRFKYHYCSFHSYLRSSSRQSSWEKLRKFWIKLFCFEIWNIGIVRNGIASFLTMPNQKIEWLKQKNFSQFRADSFGFAPRDGERKKIFFESYNFFLRKGEISCLELDEGLNIVSQKKVLQQKKHVSYPYLFCDGDKKFALVESYKEKKLTLYEVWEDGHFAFVCNLFEGLEIVDPSIVKHNGKWWLFFTLNDQGDSNLHIAFSDNLRSGWQMHQGNPVKIDNASARCGGEIFLMNDQIFRPAQNCSKSYGESLVINKILKLDEKEFLEEKEIDIFPNQLGQYPAGLHTISKLGENLTLVDGKKIVFAPHKPLIALLRIFYKIFLSTRKS